MPLASLRNPGCVATKPGFDLSPRVGDRLRAFEHARVAHQPQKRQQAWPGQAHPVRPVELRIEPVTGGSVLGKRSDVGIDEQVGIDEDHLKASCSATARTSATLSTLLVRARPAT